MWIDEWAAKPTNVAFYGERVLLLLVEEALLFNKEIHVKGVIQKPEDLELMVKLHFLDLVLTTKDSEAIIAPKAKTLGILVRRLKMHLA